MRTILGLGLVLVSLSAFANNFTAVEEEARYNAFMNAIVHNNSKGLFAFTSSNQKLVVDALWDAQEVGEQNVSAFLDDISSETFPIGEQLRLAVIAYRAGKRDDLSILNTSVLTSIAEDRDLGQLVISLRYDLYAMGLKNLVDEADKLYPTEARIVSATERPVGDQSHLALDLWNFEPDLSRHAGGAYENGIRIYMFCRTNRLFACLQIIKKPNHEVYRDANGEIWFQPALASSAHGLPSYQRNGNTPSGILHIDGVMPAADQTISFGKFRRLILEFLPKSNNEAATRELLPASSLQDDWWKNAGVSRDIGRSLLRVHGTGRLNDDPTSSWFPFRRTSGCISKRENTYNGIEYRDQRELLNALMDAQGLTVAYENEPKIKGLLYLIEINDVDAAVTLEDLKEMGIE